MRGIFHQSDISSSSVFIGPTWHLSLPKVGILMVTRKLFVNAARKRARNFEYSERDPVDHPLWVQLVDRF